MENNNSKLKTTKKSEKKVVQKNMSGNKAFSASKVTPKKIHKTAPRGK